MKHIGPSSKLRIAILIAGMLMPLPASWAVPPAESSSVHKTVERVISNVGLSNTHWSSVQAIRVQGVLFYFSRITVRAELAPVLDAFTKTGSPFENILFGANQVLLSGWHQESHWLVHLSVVGLNVEGTLSVLPFKQSAQRTGIDSHRDSILNDWASGYLSLGQASLQEQP